MTLPTGSARRPNTLARCNLQWCCNLQWWGWVITHPTGAAFNGRSGPVEECGPARDDHQAGVEGTVDARDKVGPLFLPKTEPTPHPPLDFPP